MGLNPFFKGRVDGYLRLAYLATWLPSCKLREFVIGRLLLLSVTRLVRRLALLQPPILAARSKTPQSHPPETL